MADGGDMFGQNFEVGQEYISNDPGLEIAWAMKAFEHARVHLNLLAATDPTTLRLSNSDDAIYAKFKQDFPADYPLDCLTEEVLKSAEAKVKWRNFAEEFKEVEDYNFGTLVRLLASGVYDSDNTILVPKVQFLAIEIARNREGINSKYQDRFKEATKQMDTQS